jgi:predicted hotdog family 3-hydroxylacyl-ACP dehydratase
MSLPADTEMYMLHRRPMRLVHTLLCVEDDYAEAQTTLNVGDVGIGPDGKVEAAVLMELVAQTYAASQGHRDRLADKPTNIGYLVGAQNFHIHDPPSAGKQLLIKIRSSNAFGDFHFVDGQVLCEGSVVAGGTLKLWVQPGAPQDAKLGK